MQMIEQRKGINSCEIRSFSLSKFQSIHPSKSLKCNKCMLNHELLQYITLAYNQGIRITKNEYAPYIILWLSLFCIRMQVLQKSHLLRKIGAHLYYISFCFIEIKVETFQIWKWIVEFDCCKCDISDNAFKCIGKQTAHR